MANNLTGDFDAVLLVRVRKINALLATLHQKRTNEEASPSFPHSATVRVGSQPGPGHLPSPAVTTRGVARIQLSTPAISLPPDTTSEIMVHVHARAQYTANPGTLALPEPIHGEVRATCSAAVKPMGPLHPAGKILQVDLPQDESKIQFQPAQGISFTPLEFAQLLAEIRKEVREGFDAVNTEVPDDFPFRQFKELGGGQALALPMSLTPGTESPAQGLNTVTNNFLNDDLSIGISREFVEEQLQPTFQNLKGFQRNFPIRISFGPFSVRVVTYHVSVKSVELEWKSGSIDLVVRAKATGPLDYDITVRQGLTLAIDAANQRVILQASNNNLSISVSGIGGGFLESRVRNSIIPVRDAELPKAENLINKQLTAQGGALPKMNEGLKSVDSSAGARFTAVRITPDGLILDGRIFTAFRNPPLVTFKETVDGHGFTALESWIPAGRIERFEWSWVFQNPFSVWGQQVGGSSDDHRFILPKPAPPAGPLRWVLGDVCLRVEGLQTDVQGNEILLSGGESCSADTPEVAWRMAAGTEALTVPVWVPEIPLDAVLNDAVAAHVELLPAHRRVVRITANSLVHFADPRLDGALTALGAALARGGRKSVPLWVMVVLPPGTFSGRRREVEARLGSIGEEFSGHLLLTEDSTGAWNRSFGGAYLPSTFLFNAPGDLVWKHAGVLDGEGLARAMDEHLGSGRPPKFRRAGIASAPCERVPPVSFTDDRGQPLKLRKLRGHRVLLNFWQSWSAPCIRDLRRMQAVQAKGGKDAPVIVAVNGGEKPEVLSDVRRKYSLGFALVPDPERTIARQFGIECWPTTVTMDPEGRVEGVQFGAFREYAAENRRGAVPPRGREERR